MFRSKNWNYSAFVSHSSKNREVAERLAGSLEGSGLKCWIAPRDVQPSKDYADEITRGIKQSKCFILLLSDDANLSDHVLREVALAAGENKPIYPVKVEDVPPSLKLEYLIAIHEWLDVWEGSLEERAKELVAAIVSNNRWVKNRKRRRRRLVAGGLGTLSAACMIALALIFDGDFRYLLKDEQERARDAIQELGVGVSVDGLKIVLATGDSEKINTILKAGISERAIAIALKDHQTAVDFMANSNGDADTTEWLSLIAQETIDVNAPIVAPDGDQMSLLHLALRHRNIDAALALLKAGASPHAATDLYLRTDRLPFTLFPYAYLASGSPFTDEENRKLAAAFTAAGAIIPTPIQFKDLSMPNVRRHLEAVDQIEKTLGVSIQKVRGLCSFKDNSICRSATKRTGWDWCSHPSGMPKHLYSKGMNNAYPEYSSIWPVQLINIYDDKAVYLVALIGGYRPGYGLAEVTKDHSSLTIYKRIPPGYGLGICRKASNGGTPDECWRKISLRRTGSNEPYTLEGNYSYEVSQC